MWIFYNPDGTQKVAAEGGGGGGGDADTLDGYNSTAFVFKAGDTMLGTLTLSGAPSNNNDAATKLYVDTTAASEAAAAVTSKVETSGDTMTGDLIMSGGGVQITLPNAPTLGTDAANKDYVDTTALLLTGGSLTGDLELLGTSSLLLDDNSALSWSDVAIERATLGLHLEITTGSQIRVFQDPVDPNDVARKSYVDNLVTGGGLDLDDLGDVSIAAPVIGDVLTYDGATWSSFAPLPAADTLEVVTASTHTATIDFTTILCDSTSNAIALTLPDAVDIPAGTRYTVKDTSGTADTNNITISGTGGELIDGVATYTLTTEYEWVAVVYDGSAWHVVG